MFYEGWKSPDLPNRYVKGPFLFQRTCSQSSVCGKTLPISSGRVHISTLSLINHSTCQNSIHTDIFRNTWVAIILWGTYEVSFRLTGSKSDQLKIKHWGLLINVRILSSQSQSMSCFSWFLQCSTWTQEVCRRCLWLQFRPLPSHRWESDTSKYYLTQL